MEQHQRLATTAIEHAANVITYTGAASTLLFWGLRINEVCAIISTAVAVAGFLLQCYVHRRKIWPR